MLNLPTHCMKAVVLFCSLLLTGGWLYQHHSRSAEALTTYSYKPTKAKRAGLTPVPPMRIVIDKAKYELTVYDQKGWYATYPVVFGANPREDKKMEGDRRTPEGSFKIVAKRPHQKWSRFMALDYPNQESLMRFMQRKQRGELPRNATPGGGVGIHGTWPHDEYMIDRYSNWTNGCIALKNEDVQELYGYIPVGTPVSIRK